MLLAAFIILIIIAVGLLPLTFTATAKFDNSGFSLNLRVRLAHAITLYGWDSDEEGLSFLFKKRVKKEDKKNRRIKKIIRRVFSPDSLLNIKGMTITKFEVLGVIATSDAAKLPFFMVLSAPLYQPSPLISGKAGQRLISTPTFRGKT